MTLTDKRIVVTRAPHQAGELVALLREREAVPLIFPCVDIAPPADPSGFDAALRNLHAYDWLVVTSSSAVLAIKRRLGTLEITPDLARMKIAAVGTPTAHAVQEFFGMHDVVIPEDQPGANLLALVNPYEGMRVLLPQSSTTHGEISEMLGNAGADTTIVEAYRTIKGSGGEDVPLMLTEKRIDALTFTSTNAIHYFIQRVDPQTAYDLPAACLGTGTADAARQAGFQHVLTADHFSLHAMLDLLDNNL